MTRPPSGRGNEPGPELWAWSAATEVLLPPAAQSLTPMHQVTSLRAVTYDRPRPTGEFWVNIQRTFRRPDGSDEVTEFVGHDDTTRSPTWSHEQADELLAAHGWVRVGAWARPFPAVYYALGPYWEAPIRRRATRDAD